MEQQPIARLVCKAGLLALCLRMDVQGELILGIARQFVNDPVTLDISSSMIYSMRGDRPLAIELLKCRTLREFPSHELAKAALGILLQADGQDGWQDIFGEILSTSSDSEARDVARKGTLAGSTSCFVRS
jgi:hypothetical protein